MKTKRIFVDRGISIYRRYKAWSIDVNRDGGQKRWSLHTTNRDHALAIARGLAAEIGICRVRKAGKSRGCRCARSDNFGLSCPPRN